jgi:hypothetical protein
MFGKPWLTRLVIGLKGELSHEMIDIKRTKQLLFYLFVLSLIVQGISKLNADGAHEGYSFLSLF